jgi:hypothetical protein
VFHLDVAKVDMRYFICGNDNIHIFQAYVQSVSIVSDACFKCFHLDVAYVCYGCTHMFQVFVFMCFRCFRLNLQVDLDVVYIVMAIHTYFKTIFEMFMCFSCMLQIFIFMFQK